MSFYPFYPFDCSKKTHSNEQLQSDEQPEKCNNRCNELTPSKAILRCNRSSDFEPIVIILEPASNQTFNQTIARVNINTSCLHYPTVLIDFSGTIYSLADGASFSFTLFKTCEGDSLRQDVTTFNYNTFPSSFGDNHAIKFKYSSCDTQCDDCCIYTLELTSVSNLSDFQALSLFSINGMLCALAVDSQ